MSFQALGLSPEILQAVKAKEYKTPTPIQLQAIPIIMDNQDIIGCAQTGTGKTAGFTLPILHKLRNGKPRSLRALVLAPTRELAAQVHESIRTYGRYLHLKTTVVFGGVGQEPQRAALRRGVDILVATPGRLLDHHRQGNVRFKDIEILVIDEADRMLDMGFLPDIRTILQNVPSKRQTLLFSATMPAEIQKLANEILKHPKKIEITRNGTPADGIRQCVYPVEAHKKQELLFHLIEKEDMNQVLIFTRTKRRADYLTQKLDRKGLSVIALHSDKSQSARTKAMEAFRKGKVKILVATNIAARGLDIRKVSHVINFEIPSDPEDYIHRIGRTGRAEDIGDAISLVSPEEVASIRNIERLMGTKIRQVIIPGFEPSKQFSRPPGKRTFRPSRQRAGQSAKAEVFQRDNSRTKYRMIKLG